MHMLSPLRRFLEKIDTPPSPQLRFFWLWVPPLAWAVLIYILSNQSNLPGFDVSLYDYLFKKSAHMFVYGVLYFLFFRALNWKKPLSHANWWAPFALIMIYAVSDEVHQYFTPTRVPSPRDVGYDLLGATLVWLKIYRYI